MRPQWIAATLLIVCGAALTVSWQLGFWTSVPPPEAVPAAVQTPKPRPAPLHPSTWMSETRPSATDNPGAPAPPLPEASCGATAEPCADGALCIDGGCFSTTCGPDAGESATCARAVGQLGACCLGSCADLADDKVNCGYCGLRCSTGLDCIAGRCQTPSCTGRMAGTACSLPDRQTGACCHDGCVEMRSWATDLENCGGCGNVCAPDLICSHRQCVDPATDRPPTWTCHDPPHTCPGGTVCVLDTCVPQACSGGNNGVFCTLGTEGQLGHCCGQICTNLFEDSDNCRACGDRCGSGQTCHNGECGVPEP